MNRANPYSSYGVRYGRALRHRPNVKILDRSPRPPGLRGEFSQWQEIDPATLHHTFRGRLWQIEELSHRFRWVVVQPASDTGKLRVFVSDQPTFTLDN